MSSSHQRIIPSLERLYDASRKLPPPEKASTDTLAISLKGESSLHFRRVKMKDAQGKGYRWLYEGKVVVSSAED